MSDNRYLKSPPMRMNDGRAFTDYRPNCDVNNQYRVNNGIPNSYQYRLFMTQNAEKIMQNDRMNTCKHLTISEIHPGVQLDELTKITCNANTCEEKVFNKNGLGQGRNYGGNNELPNMYNHYQCCPTKKALVDKANEINQNRPQMPPLQEQRIEDTTNVISEQPTFVPMEEEIVNLQPLENAPPIPMEETLPPVMQEGNYML